MPDFLVLTYPDCDFLCLKDEFVASTSRVVDGNRVKFGTLALPEVDLEGLLRSIFPGLPAQNAGLLLICSTQRLFCRSTTSPTDEWTALRVGSDSSVETYAFGEFRLLPFLLRAPLLRQGLTAIRFTGTKIQYLLDLPLLLDGQDVRWTP